MKRFWQRAEATPAEDATWGAGWGVALDGRPVRVPGGTFLRLPTRRLAEAIAGEWQGAGGGVGGTMSYADLPLTRLAGTAQERIAPDPEPVALELARYAESDLLCYRADHPEALAERQAACWHPWLDWAERRYGARLRVTRGVVHVAQPPAALAALAAAVAAHDAPALAGLGVLIPAFGSAVLGLAVADAALDAAEAHALALLDETFQSELWGIDAEAEARRVQVGADVAVAARFIALTRSERA